MMSASAAEGPRPMRTFYTIWLGQLISVIGTQLSSFGLAVYIVERTGRATPFALVVLFGQLPALLLSPIAGSVIDRFSRRIVMLLADTLAALTTVAAAILLFTGQLEIWHIYVVAAFGSVAQAFQEPAYTAAITMIVPKDQFGRASGMVQMAQAVGQLIAPLAAGFLYVAIGLRGMILIDFATYFFAVGALLMVRIPDPERQPPAEGEEKSIWQDAAYGWTYITARRGLLAMMVWFAFVNFFANFAAVLSPPMILASENAAVLGVVQGLAGIGMLIGSILMSAWGGPKDGRNMRAVFAFIMMFSVGFAVFGLRPSPVFYTLGFALVMFAMPLGSGNSQAIWQRKVEPDVQGRVFATRSMISRSIMPLAFLIAGPLADRIFEPLMAEGGALAPIFGPLIGVGQGRGIGLIFVFSGIMIGLVSLAAYAYKPLRNVERDLPDVVPDTPPADAAADEASAAGETATSPA